MVDPRNGGAAFGHLLLAVCFGAFFAGYSKADTEMIYSGRYSPNLLAAALAVVAGCMVHYCNFADFAFLKGRNFDSFFAQLSALSGNHFAD